MTLGRNGVMRYGHFGEFLEFFGDRMADLGLIDSKLGHSAGKHDRGPLFFT